MLTRRLGHSTLEVSALSLGSWRTFERIDREQGLAVMETARAAGINFLDDARYDDETGTAPMRTGYSEVVFGELFARSGWIRDEVVVANKLWWEFWPDQSAVEEVEGSLGRMGFDYLDVIYCSALPERLPLEVVVESVADLLRSGRARHWAIVNWPGETLEEVSELCDGAGIPQPCAAQLPYNVLQRDWVEGDPMQRALERTGASVVASACLAGGALSGKYQRGESGRLSGHGGSVTGRVAAAAAAALADLGQEWNASAAQLAISFVLDRPRVGSVLFGATSPDQVEENRLALEVLARLDGPRRRRLEALAGD